MLHVAQISTCSDRVRIAGAQALFNALEFCKDQFDNPVRFSLLILNNLTIINTFDIDCKILQQFGSKGGVNHGVNQLD